MNVGGIPSCTRGGSEIGGGGDTSVSSGMRPGMVVGRRMRKVVVEAEAGGGFQRGRLLQELMLMLVLLVVTACVMC